MIVVNATSGNVTWTVKNEGDVLTGVPTLANSNPTEVMISQNNCTAALGGGGTCTVIVAFRPSSTTPPARTGTLTLSAPGAGSVTFTASATALSAASLTLAPDLTSQSDFGNVVIGDMRDETFVVTNGGQQNTSAITVSFTSATTEFVLLPQTGDCANGTTLTMGATCLIHVRFKPTTNLMRTASLGVSATTGGSGALTLIGMGQAAAALTLTALSGQPTTNLGYVIVGDSATATFVLKNSGDQTASGIAVGLTAAPGFSRGTGLADDCGTSLAGPGKTCQIRVVFTPTAGGMATTTVSVNATVGGITAAFGVTGIGQPKAVFTSIPLPTGTGASGPDGIALASDGTVWFTETTAAKIGRLDPATGIITEYPLAMAASAPVGIAAAADSLWFTESGTNTIGRIALDGTINEFATVVGATPTGIALGGDGAFWFTESMGNGIGRMTTAGDYSDALAPTPGAQPQGIAQGSDGNLWFTESAGNNIGILANTVPPIVEKPIGTASAGPFGIASGADGRVWFSEQSGNKIGAITTAGTITEYPIPTAGSQPTGIARGIDLAGSVHAMWFVEQSGAKVARITDAGVVTEFAMPAGSAPQSIVSDASGTLYLTDPGANRILKVTFP
jgi:streptogramin lyase